LRFSDLLNLKEENLHQDGNDSTYLKLKMQKTKDFIFLPVQSLYEGKPLNLLCKYINNDKEFILPQLTNQHVNRSLKIIGRLANTSKPITFHMSRHTFGTDLLNKGLPIESVQKLMGHKKLQQTQEYAKLLNLTVIKQLNQVFNQ
jgi:integrase